MNENVIWNFFNLIITKSIDYIFIIFKYAYYRFNLIDSRVRLIFSILY